MLICKNKNRIQVITLLVIFALLCQNTSFSSLNTDKLSVNSPFDEDPRNNRWRKEMGFALEVQSNALVYEPFEISLEKALTGGTFNTMLGVQENLEVLETEQVGDNHCYFTIREITIKPNATTVIISYIKKNEQGYGVETSEEHQIDGDFRANPRKVYDKINDLAFEILVTRKQLNNIFQNHTRLVKLRGITSGREYKVYYKFGKPTRMELHTSRIFAEFGLTTPTFYQPQDEKYLWVTHVTAKKLHEFLPEKSTGVKNGTPTVASPELNDLFIEIGRTIALMFLLGNGDMHSGNLLVDPYYKAYIIDQETIGQEIFYSSEDNKVYREVHKIGDNNDRLIAFLNTNLASLFANDYFRPYVDLCDELKEKIVEGITTFFEGILESPEALSSLREILAPGWTDNLYTRIVTKATTAYPGYLPIPHYSKKISSNELFELAKRRLDIARSFFYRYRISIKKQKGILFFLEKKKARKNDPVEISL